MPVIDSSETIGFIGLGIMGSSMAKRLLAAGFKVRLHTRTKSKAQPIIDAGGLWIPNLKDLPTGCRAIITMLGYPEEVEQVYFGSDGLLVSAELGTLLIDMTTSQPALAQRIYEEGLRRHLQVLDAPVSGGDIGARDGRLSIMVGGETEAFEDAQKLLATLGSRIVLHGSAGSGQRMKLCNQIAVFGNTLGTCESMAFAVKAGLDPVKVLDTLGGGSAWSFNLGKLAPRILAADFTPGFYVRHFVKDINLALAEAEALGLPAPGLKLARELYGKLVQDGLGDRGTQALYLLLNGI